jgi:hypothetical protein
LYRIDIPPIVEISDDGGPIPRAHMLVDGRNESTVSRIFTMRGHSLARACGNSLAEEVAEIQRTQQEAMQR